MECNCPKPTNLTTIPDSDCPENLNQIQKVAFQRPGFVFSTTATPTPNPITAQASWTPLLTAIDDTKVVISPFLESAAISRPEAITRGGGDNSTLNGVEKVMGANSATFTALLTSIQNASIEAMKLLSCEQLVAYFFNEFGQIAGITSTPATPGNTVGGIPIQSLFVSDADNNGFATDDMAELRFGLKYGWRKNLAIIKPAFNPLNLG